MTTDDIRTAAAALTQAVDATYPDRSPGDKAHQEDHDGITALFGTVADEIDAASGTSALGSRLWVPARDFQSIAGVATFDTLRTGAVGWPMWLLDSSSAEGLQQAGPLPNDQWATLDVDIYWTNGGAGAGDVAWSLGTNFVGGGDNTTTGTTTHDPVVVTAPAQYVLEVTPLVAGVAVTATDFLSLRLLRLPADAGDTLANDAAFYGLLVRQAS